MSSNIERKSFRFTKLLIILTALAWFASKPVRAGMVTYTLTGTLSGTIGTMNLTDTPYVVTGVGDSAGAFGCLCGSGYIANPVEYQLSISGLGVVSTLDGGYVLYFPLQDQIPHEGRAEFFLTGIPNSLGSVTGSFLSTWDDVSPIGPVSLDKSSGGGLVPSSGGLIGYYTKYGNLYVSSSQESVFAVTSTPEPSTLIMCGLCVGLLLVTAHRRRRQRARNCHRSSIGSVRSGRLGLT